MKLGGLGRLSSSCILLLVLVMSWGGISACGKKKKSKPKAPVASAQPESIPTEATTLPLEPGATSAPSLLPSPSPQETASPFPNPMATSVPGVGIPQAESLPAESLPSAGALQMGASIKTAEGTTLVLDQVQWQGPENAATRFLWTLVSGPAEQIEIEKPTTQNPRVKIGNLEAPTEWSLALQVGTAPNQVIGQLKIQAFPAHLQFQKRVGGAWVGIKKMGDKWVTARGQKVEIYGADFSPLSRIEVGRPITQFFAHQDAQGKGNIYVQSPEGAWTLYRSDPIQGSKKTEFPQLGRSIRRLIPFEFEGLPYVFALLERSIELWSLADPVHPKLKTSLGSGFLKNPVSLALAQRTIYVAEEDRIHLIDYSTGNLIASLPSGGSVTAMGTYASEGKEWLMVAIGKDRTSQGRKDYGLRFFEILAGGRLGAEQRLSLGDQSPILHALLIPEAAKAVLVAGEEGKLSLKMLDLKQKKEIQLQGEAAQALMSGNELSSGRVGDKPVVVVSDGNQLKVLAFQPQSDGAFAVSRLQSLMSILSAAWIQSQPDGAQIWVGDEGTKNGGALVSVEGQDFSVNGAWNAPPRSYPAQADFRSGSPLSPLLYLAEDPEALKQGGVEGRLGLMDSEKKATGPELSPPLFGSQSPQGLVRASAIAAQSRESGLRMATALSRISGSGGSPGLALLEKPPTQAPKAYLNQELAASLSLIPLQDARDVVLTSDGQGAFVAAGVHGVVAVDLEKKTPVSRMSLGTSEWVADRVLLGHGGDRLLALFVNRGNRQVLIKIFGVGANYQMQEYGNIAGLPAVNTVEGLRAPRPALTDDDLYLFVPTQTRSLGVYNLSNPGAPAKIAELELEGEIRGVSLANRFKDVFVALGAAGAAKLSFGF